ncbi:MAG: DUF6505 family protein [Paracoccaceae bacterium]|tara:strand:- start:644 stop:1120 length:477 start_codon:yes stop_codon:yes gene_type:complete
MKFARTITLDESDSRIFETVANAGEWAISGTFEFSNWKEEQIEGKHKQAFTNGWMGLTSFGRSTFVGVTTILVEEYEHLIKILANKFVEEYGAPNIQSALPVAKEEIEFMNSICEEHSDNTLLMVSRELTAKGIKEKFRHIQASDAELEAFAVHGSTE